MASTTSDLLCCLMPSTAHGIARIFPASPDDPQGHANDSGYLAESIVRLLPAECLQIFMAAGRAPASIAADFHPCDCADPERGYRKALEDGHLPALLWHWGRLGPLAVATPPPPPEADPDAEPDAEPDTLGAGATVTSILAFHGHLRALWGAVAQGFPLDAQIYSYAARRGHVEILAWLHSLGRPIERAMCLEAAGLVGNLATIQWAYDLGYPIDADMCAMAAWCGHLEILQWLMAQGCKPDARASRRAASGGHLEVLKLLEAQECPFDAGASQAAVESALDGGDVAVMEWLFAVECPCDLGFCIYLARHRNNRAILTWLLAQEE